MEASPLPGVEPIELPGLSYLPRFVSEPESQELLRFFGSLRPIWEERHAGDRSARSEHGSRRLTRPVYWLGAWQFASQGYYSAPSHLEEKCLRAEPFPQVMHELLGRLAPALAAHQGESERGTSPNTCLINYYGRELTRDATGRVQPRDYARLKMHRDGEPGPVVVLSIGQPALIEFLDAERPEAPELALWLKNRSVVIFSGPHFKDHLYHRVTRVRYGELPVMPKVLDGFELRRVSVSFRFVPQQHIKAFRDYSAPAQAELKHYVETLASSSPYFRAELDASAPSR